MTSYKVFTYYKRYKGDELAVNDSTMCTCADLDAAKRVFLSKVTQLTERATMAVNYTTLICGTYVEDGDGRPLSFHVDMESED